MTDANAVPDDLVEAVSEAMRMSDCLRLEVCQSRPCICAARVARAALTAAFSIRDGYVLVPKEPTTTDSSDAVAKALEDFKKLRDDINELCKKHSTSPPSREETIEALREITEACEKDCGVPSDDDGDDEAVGAGRGEDGVIKPMALTFGMLRRARRALHKGE